MISTDVVLHVPQMVLVLGKLGVVTDHISQILIQASRLGTQMIITVTWTKSTTKQSAVFAKKFTSTIFNSQYDIICRRALRYGGQKKSCTTKRMATGKCPSPANSGRPQRFFIWELQKWEMVWCLWFFDSTILNQTVNLDES